MACCGILLLGYSFAQTDRESKLKMIRAIEQYGQKELGLKLKPGFYETWEKPDTMTCYLYISRKDSIVAPQGMGSYQFFGTHYQAADSARKKWDSLGFETLLYYTSGNSATKLSGRFLSYPPHAIAFICFHELFHRHKAAKASKLPYSFEEATCDWLGNTASESFLFQYAQQNPAFLPYVDSARFQREINMYTFRLLNLAAWDSSSRKAVSDSLNLLKTNYNLFQQDRLLYPLNNALLLRTGFYSRNLFLIQELYESLRSIPKVIQLMTRLPGNEKVARKRILRKIPR